MKRNKQFYFIIVSSVTLLIILAFIFVIMPAFTSQSKSDSNSDPHINKDSNKTIARKGPYRDTLLIVDNRKVYIQAPLKNARGAFLVLHGWNLPTDEWCTKTSLCSKATELGFFVILPDMGKSLYQDQNYPETRIDWCVYPTRTWLSDTLIPKLRNDFNLMTERDSNYLVGLSTGARGVALVLLDYPNLFKAAAALSGDYDQVQLPNDNLLTAIYGAYSTHKERWQTVDNPVYRISEFTTPLYLGHGKLDKVVPPAQTQEFYDSLVKKQPSLKIKLSMPDAAHTYDYWDSEVDSIIKFFGIQ